jgi:hypothetical protein
MWMGFEHPIKIWKNFKAITFSLMTKTKIILVKNKFFHPEESNLGHFKTNIHLTTIEL